MAGYNRSYDGVRLSARLSESIELIKKIFLRDSVLRVREINCSRNVALFYFDGMVDAERINDSIIRPLIERAGGEIFSADERIAETLLRRVLYSNEAKTTADLGEMLRAMMYGDTLLLIDGTSEGIICNSKGWSSRGISEPEDERILEGPREGFSEAIMTNLSLLRRKLQTTDLCTEMLRVGRRTDTMVYICYLGTLAPRRLVKELRRRIEKIDVDGILDTNYIAELCTGRSPSLFRRTGSTERPDIVASRLLEGRVAVLVDGSPMALTLPYLFSENFQSDEDYYQSFLTASVGRALRYLCFVLSIGLPAIFVALSVFHRRLLPTSFLLSLTEARANAPFSSVTECIALILIFEILKEAGVRTQQSLGSALSIVGGLVVGQAAVEARIVSAPMLIVVALSGIAGLMIPRLRAAVFYLRLGLVIASSLLGIYGFILGIFGVLVMILSVKSFGFDSTEALMGLKAQDYKDTVWRAPMSKMILRPRISDDRVRFRFKSGGKNEEK